MWGQKLGFTRKHSPVSKGGTRAGGTLGRDDWKRLPYLPAEVGMLPPSIQVRRHVPDPVLLPPRATDLRIGTKSETKHLEISLSI